LSHHRADILTMTKHTENDNIIATAGVDTLIKLWDVRTNDPIGTLKGHRSAINGLKFGINSNIMCSVSKDLTLKEWDVSQKGLMETFYEHNNEVLDIDHFNGTDYVTCGNDHQTIVWKTEK
jgi:WD40 repeat protein